MNPLLTLLLTLLAALGLLLLERAWASRVHVLVMAALEGGAGAAQAALDRRIPAVTQLPWALTAKQGQRAAALALIGDATRIRAEAERHDGPLHAVACTAAISWLAYVAAGGDAALAEARLQAILSRLVHDGNVLHAPVRVRLAASLDLVRATMGQPMTKETLRAARGLVEEGGAIAVLVSACLDHLPGELRAGASRGWSKRLGRVGKQAAARLFVGMGEPVTEEVCGFAEVHED